MLKRRLTDFSVLKSLARNNFNYINFSEFHPKRFIFCSNTPIGTQYHHE